MNVCLYRYFTPIAALNKITCNLSSLLLLVIIFGFEACEAISFYPTTTIEIINALNVSLGQENLTLHRKSKDDDLGFHTVMPGESYRFTFHPNIFLKT